MNQSSSPVSRKSYIFELGEIFKAFFHKVVLLIVMFSSCIIFFFPAPAHEHHVIALHRHGHHYGGLPMLFWLSIGFLILVFHLFLFKLIFNEYCQGHDNRYIRGKYNL